MYILNKIGDIRQSGLRPHSTTNQSVHKPLIPTHLCTSL